MATHDPRVHHLHVGPAEVVVDHGTRRRLGLDAWVDGTMGFHRWEGRTRVVSPNGPALAVLDLGPEGLPGRVVNPTLAIQGGGQHLDHASGGPLHHDPATGQLLLVYHGERFHHGDALDYHSFIGLAVSRDHGGSFQDLGPIVTTDRAEVSEGRLRNVDVGSGALLVHDGSFHVYFQDRDPRSIRLRMGVARAPVAQVVAAAARGESVPWTKYHDGAFSEPGLGGRAQDLLAGVQVPVLWFDTVHIPAMDRYLLVFSTVLGSEGPHGLWNHVAMWSPDAVHWDGFRLLYEEDVRDEILYVTIDSGGPQRTVTGDGFDLYRLRSTTAYRWDDSWLERVRVTLGPVGGAGA